MEFKRLLHQPNIIPKKILNKKKSPFQKVNETINLTMKCLILDFIALNILRELYRVELASLEGGIPVLWMILKKLQDQGPIKLFPNSEKLFPNFLQSKNLNQHLIQQLKGLKL